MPTKGQLSQQQHQQQQQQQNTDAERNTPAEVPHDAANRRLEDRIALFFQGLEHSTDTNAGGAHQTTPFSAMDVADPERLPRSTADPVQTQSQVFVLLNNETEDGVPQLHSNDAALSQPQKRRGKRIRCDASPHEEIASNLSGTHSPLEVGEMYGRSRLRPFATNPVTTPRLIQPSEADIRQGVSSGGVTGSAAFALPSVGPGQTMIDVRVLSHIHPVDVTALATVSGGISSIPSLGGTIHPPGRISEQTSDTSKMSPIEKAKLDWETHITALEQVLVANREQGLPKHSISLDALQLLSQMVSNLYALNAKLLYAETQRVLDEHRQNAKRIEDVFQGLAGVKRQEKKED